LPVFIPTGPPARDPIVTCPRIACACNSRVIGARGVDRPALGDESSRGHFHENHEIPFKTPAFRPVTATPSICWQAPEFLEPTCSRSATMEWETPTAVDFRFGMEITMYIANR
ncbi:MAG TPA: pyrroloquinoline quinone precursor peptide PqqA, partial [Povalibacter sp.]|nr:pyrroloquinoline quinone precursor peptide PqqA [Povalibacter sp.]